jgi:lipid-binding SYLF domain-containing protein
MPTLLALAGARGQDHSLEVSVCRDRSMPLSRGARAMKQTNRRMFVAAAVATLGAALALPAWADEYEDTIAVFRKADEAGKFFSTAYGYAVFPTIGKGAIGIGGAHGKGRVYEKGAYIGDSTMNQLSIGFQLGGQGFSQMIFFQNEAALKKFTSEGFEFGAEANAVAITAGASAKAGTTGATATANVDKDKSKAAGSYNNGMAIFTLVKGGLMYEVSLAGQKYSFKKH